MEFVKIHKSSFSADITKQIKDKILNQEWKPGDKIPSENELCQLFGVSRVSVRSSMDQLRGQGLIMTYQGKGSYISKDALKILSDSFEGKIYIKKEDYMDIIAFRSALEITSMDLLQERATDADLARICEALKKMEDSIGSIKEYTKADFQFHYSIILASHNKIFKAIIDQNKELFMNYLEFQNMRKESDNFAYSIENHKAICNAIIARNFAEAKNILNKSFIRNSERLYK